ncbi:MAG: PDZ domain-containing protein [Alphaproteobacteria bacterium]|nr:PDZ domain-containing protein [Alphaproteobacteria bacterium]MCB9696797.1 PDZ domain-containing protein [Alphaproteobacteria bacterium]
MDLGAEQLRQDLAVVVQALREVHPDAVDAVGHERFEAMVVEAEEALEDGGDAGRLWVVAAPLVAAVGDGHTLLLPPPAPPGRATPWRIEARDGQLWVEGWGSSSGPSLPFGGARLLSVDEVPAGDLLGALLERVPGETEGFRRVVAGLVLPWALAPTIDELRGEAVTGPYHVVLALEGGRRKLGVVSELAAPRASASLNAVWTSPEEAPWAVCGGDGAVVGRVVPGGVADQAGLRPGDRVISMDGEHVDAEGLTERVRGARIGALAHLEIERCGTPAEVLVTLGPALADPRDHVISFTEEAAVLRVDSWHDRGSFRRDLRDLTAVARRGGIGHLVVDLRGNPGGEIGAVEQLAASLCREPVAGYVTGWRRSEAAEQRERASIGMWMPLARASSPELRSFLRAPLGAVATIEGDPYEPRGEGSPFQQVSVLVDAATYSSSILAADVLRRCANAQLVGEEPGSPTHFHTHNLPVVLPATGMTLLVATGWLHTTPEAVALAPDVPVPASRAMSAALGRRP